MFYCNSNDSFEDKLKKYYDKYFLDLIKQEKLIKNETLNPWLYIFIKHSFQGWLPYGAELYFRNIRNPLTDDELFFIETSLRNLVDTAKFTDCIRFSEDKYELTISNNKHTNKLLNLLTCGFFLIQSYTKLVFKDMNLKQERMFKISVCQEIIRYEMNRLLVTNKIHLKENIDKNDDLIFDKSPLADINNQINKVLIEIIHECCMEVIYYGEYEISDIDLYTFIILIGEEHLKYVKNYSEVIPKKYWITLKYSKKILGFMIHLPIIS